MGPVAGDLADLVADRGPAQDGVEVDTHEHLHAGRRVSGLARTADDAVQRVGGVGLQRLAPTAGARLRTGRRAPGRPGS